MYFVLTATIIQIQPRARFPSNGWITTTFLYQAIDDPRRRFLDNRSLLDLFPQELPGIQTLRTRLPLMVEGPWGFLHPVFFPFFFRCLYPYRFTTIPRRAKISTVYCFRFPRRAVSPSKHTLQTRTVYWIRIHGSTFKTTVDINENKFKVKFLSPRIFLFPFN